MWFPMERICEGLWVREAHLDLINKNLRLLTKHSVLGYEGNLKKKFVRS